MNKLGHKGDSLEKISTCIYSDTAETVDYLAKEIACLIRENDKKGKKTVLSFAMGATQAYLFRELTRMHKEENLSFKNVILFNASEYYPIEPESPQSHHTMMHQKLIDLIDIPFEQVHLLDGNVPIDTLDEYCHQYEKKIKKAGGIDIQILGIGRTGRIGYNEPGSTKKSRTRLVKLTPLSLNDAAANFLRKEFVPLRAITVGIKTILKSKRIFLLAWGERKANVLKETIEGHVSQEVPASFLQEHPEVEIVIDRWAALSLTRVKHPWLVRAVRWDEELTKRAVIWLSQTLKKPLLKLTDDDYRDNNLGDLLIYYGNSYDLNIQIFNLIQNTITGWPGGKPGSDDTNRPERAEPAKKRVVIFSPHPDDDVISMGGTLLRLVEQGHEVHVAYQTSGNIAVHDDDAWRFADFATDMYHALSMDCTNINHVHEKVVNALKRKKPGETDIPEVKTVKGLIRKGEATAACRFSGVQEDKVHFLNMPFYETGSVEKSPLGADDIRIVKELLAEVKPHQVYAAGDLRDPHGTHKVCLDAVFAALEELKSEDWTDDCYLWLYRGAWQEWDIHEIEMAVPISPKELLKKRKAIFKHQSQKDAPVFPGADTREFWQRAEDRNKLTAKTYDELGMTEYEAMEAFVRFMY